MGNRVGRTLTVLVVTIVSMLSVSGLAQAQGLSICEQYPDAPACQPADNGGGNPTGTGPAAANPAGTADSLGAATGSLPFTGYPVSPMILFALLLILIGLLVRATSAAGRRARALTAGNDSYRH